MYTIGVDIGGTSIKAGVVDEKGNITLSLQIPTKNSPNACIESIINLIKELIEKSNLTTNQIKGIGFGFPGMVNSKTGVVDFLPNINGWENIDFSSKIENAFGVKVKITNDANAHTLAEQKYGSAKGANNVVMLTLGTGVGGGVIIDGKLYEGEGSKGTELGHTTLILGGNKCGCGRKGCLEAYVSTTALINQAKEQMLENKDSALWHLCNNNLATLNGKIFFTELNNGDKTAEKVFDKYIIYLSEGLLNFCNIFRPEIIVLGGGISAQGKVLTDKITKYCKDNYYGLTGAPEVKIVTATLSNDAGIIGASALI
ncbi:MAG: ROK family protein [Clostridia bacterium]|nr:ROK family protein [Clostridia bacterium]